MTQEQINALRLDIANVTRQIQILSGEEFADTVPEIETAKHALEAYKAEAERQVAEYEAARTAQAAAPSATGISSGQVNLAALTAAIQSNPTLQSILGTLLQNAAASASAAR